MRALLRAVAACALCAGLAALTPIGRTTFAGDNATLSGIVTDSEGLSLQSARVTISGDGVGTATIFTDIKGTYRFPGLRPLTTYTLTAAVGVAEHLVDAGEADLVEVP